MEITKKDFQRIYDIQAQPGKEISLATKMAKLIKDAGKAERRWLAALAIFGASPVAQIFSDRVQELKGGTPVAKIAPKVEVAKVEETIKMIERTQRDFPVGCKIKYNGEIGAVVEHSEDTQQVQIKTDTIQGAVSIYDLKRA